ncbi:hypothetical protein CF394_00790 [Tetzosporium hominis]|uniref:Uncharacterized protein n=1 Tax=Tetzosporium hominis TaxID=2020506 RepID=A0A264W789_9BACL|nr:hypothetical protein [Tetzosporium hominis]OZS79474.1 hypothetical protein CF394_00790 [Tetzosporium hominis]
MKNPVRELQGNVPPNAARLGDKIAIIRGENERVDGLNPTVVAVYENCVYACLGRTMPFEVKHGEYIIITRHDHKVETKVKLERWREEEKEILYELQEEVADENPSKDASRYWEAKNAYDKQKLKIETIEAAMQIADGK